MRGYFTMRSVWLSESVLPSSLLSSATLLSANSSKRRHWRLQINSMSWLVAFVLATYQVVPVWADDDFVRHHLDVERQSSVGNVAAPLNVVDGNLNKLAQIQIQQQSREWGKVVPESEASNSNLKPQEQLDQQHRMDDQHGAENTQRKQNQAQEQLIEVQQKDQENLKMEQQNLHQIPQQQQQQLQSHESLGLSHISVADGGQKQDLSVKEVSLEPNLRPVVVLSKTENSNNQQSDLTNTNNDNHVAILVDSQLKNNMKKEPPFQDHGVLTGERADSQSQVTEISRIKLAAEEHRPQPSDKEVSNNEFGRKGEPPVAVSISNSYNSQSQNRDTNYFNAIRNNFNPVLGITVSPNVNNSIDSGKQNGQKTYLNSQNAFNGNSNQWVRNDFNNPQQQQQQQGQQQPLQPVQQQQQVQQQPLQPVQHQQQVQQQPPQLEQQQQQQQVQQQPPQPEQQQQQQQVQQQPLQPVQQQQQQWQQHPPQPEQQQQWQQQPLQHVQQQPPQPEQQQQQQPPQPVQQQQQQWQQQPVQQQQQWQQQPPQSVQQQRQLQIGGINISWDWEDFSVLFNSYGAAEMKVRRSPHPSTGEPWPLPQYYTKKDDRIFKVSKDLRFVAVGFKCHILEEGFVRHLQRSLQGSVEDMYDNLQNAEGSPIEDPALRYAKEEFVKAPLITRLEVKVRKPCSKYPSLESDESYDLVVKKKKTYIWANEVWGALRGLETFGHLVWKGTDDFLYIKETVIGDYPRFPHRGLLVDTSRHYLFKEVILDILDCMEMNKLNVFHWHIVDDQSFPYESKVYPELSRKGAFHPTYVYSLEDIAEITEYARLRGIRVMPEFDTPGHTYAWGLSRPELLTQCYSGNTPVKGYLGPIDPSKNSTYRFLQALFEEIVEVFKDEYLHLGGDEVPLGCWQSNPEVIAFAQELAKRPRNPQAQQQGNQGGWSMWSEDIRRVYEYYENRLISSINEIGEKKKKKIKYVMWQEVMNNNLQLPNDTIIQVWMGDMADVNRATSMGYQVLYSTCWYMDHIEYGTKWIKYYNCDPVDQSFGYRIDEKKVLGGEAAFWAEYFSNENLIPLMWPRASAAAERLWSNKDVRNIDKAGERLSEHRCRMIKRGINVGEINGPGYCLHAPPKRHLLNETAGCRGGNCNHTRSFFKENVEVFVSQRLGSLADCGSVFTRGNGSVLIMLTLAIVVVVALYALSKSSNRFHRIRTCKNRSILIVFVVVLLVYFLCNTTIWMRAYEFSGSFHKTLQEDNTSETDRNHADETAALKTDSS